MIPRRNIIQRVAGIALVLAFIWFFNGRQMPEHDSSTTGLVWDSLGAFGILIGIWLFFASFVYPKTRK